MIKKLIISLFFIAFCVAIVPKVTVALTAAEVRKQIDDTNAQIEALDKEIVKYQSQITETSAQKATLASLVKELTLTRNKLIKEREQIQKKISATGLVINSLSTDIKEKENIIDVSKRSLSQMIKDLNQNDDIPIFERLLTVDNFTDFSREYNNLLTLNQKIRENIIGVSQKKVELLNSKIQKEDEQQNLNVLKNNLVQKEKVVAITKSEKDTLLNKTKNQEAEYQRLLAEKIKIRDAFDKALEDYEAQLKFILNPKLIPSAGSRVFSWPLNYILVTSPYGSRWGKFHYGLDFRASVGTEVMAMASGTVEAIGDTDLSCPKASFGKWVFIRYNNGLSSTYGHLSVITAKAGQKVVAGDVVGLSGNTGSSTGPHLHVGVYASDGVKVDTVPSKSCNGKIFTQPIAALTAYLDPARFLPPITDKMVKK